MPFDTVHNVGKCLRVLMAAGALWASFGSDAHGQGEDEAGRAAQLRTWEDELFGSPAARPRTRGRVLVTSAPAALSSDAPATAPSAESAPRPTWLAELNMPDIPVRLDPRVIRFLEFFHDDARGRRFIRGWLERVERYGPMIRAVLRRHSLPEDLLFVAMVESGFDPMARSHAAAVGMWQFVRRTGEWLGLRVDHWVDERRDPELSTDAAARYLRSLHDRLGTWELALAAYNMGYGALLRSIRKYNTNDYWELAGLEAGLPHATTLYVPKVMACAIVAHNLRRFGMEALQPQEPLRWETVEVPAGTALRRVARAAGSDLETLRELNPSLLRSRVPPGPEPRTVRIPAGRGERFASRFGSRQATNATYTMRFGEDLSDVARALGTTEASLRSRNELGETQAVGPGTVLVTPRPRRVSESTERPIVPVAAGVPEAIEGRRRVFYRAVRGDSLRSVAGLFEVDVEDLMRWNRFDPHAELHRGMYVQVFVNPSLDISRVRVLTPDRARVLTVGSEEFLNRVEEDNGRRRVRYRVREGDTLTRIGRRFGIDAASLARINRIAPDATLRIGQRLVVYAPAGRSRASTSRRTRPRPSPSEPTDEGAAEASPRQAETGGGASPQAGAESSAPSGESSEAPPAAPSAAPSAEDARDTPPPPNEPSEPAT